MPTPLEKQVLEDYAEALSASAEVTPSLQAALIEAISGDKVPSAEIDALQVAWVAGAILFFLRAFEEEEKPTGEPGGVSPRSASQNDATRFWLLSALCLAAGTLTKWTAPAFLYGTAIPLLWYRGRLRLLFGRRHLLALGFAVALVLGWITLAVSRTSAAEFMDAIVREAAPRLVPSEHPKPCSWIETILHPVIVLAVMLPWSLFPLILWRGTRSPSPSMGEGRGGGDPPGAYAVRLAVDKCPALGNDRARRLYQALQCWLWPNLLFWSLHPDHTLRNRAPLFPAVAGLAVFALLAWQRTEGLPRWLRSPRAWLTGFLILWTAVKAVQVNVIIPERSDERRVREKALTIAALLPAGAPLYLCKLKDECLLFFLGLPAQRVDCLADLPHGQICILTEEEWREHRHATRLLLKTADGQGRPIYVMQRAMPSEPKA